ncbi:MAG: hypothetical protein ABSB35_38340 [Bryobacteraceae bacterium]|jgi:hypothetical protein
MRHGIMEHERILRMLRAQLAAAQYRRDEAAERFTEILRDVPSGIPKTKFNLKDMLYHGELAV